MAKYNVSTFDLEICKSPEQCSNGWASHEEFGISVMAVCFHNSGDYRIELFDETNLQDGLKCLAEADLISGFNSIHFDMPVLMATTLRLGLDDMELWGKPHYDVYKAIRDTGVFMRVKGLFNLGAIAKNTLGREKTDHGANAPLMFQSGEMEKLRDYCREDVRLEADLVRFVEQNGYIIDGNGERLDIARASELLPMRG